MLAARCRPVGGVQQQVGVLGVAAPHREAQVVADQRANPPAFPLQQHLMLARRVVLVLTGHAEQVALVVVQDFAVRARPQQAVAVAAVGGADDHAAGDHRVQARRLLAQPGVGGALLRLAEALRIHGEAGGEHLRQDHQVRTARLLQQSGEARAVGLGVMPGQGGLHQGELEVRQLAQIAHSFSAA
ncbi:hypothetical protein D3C76_1223270 [compost metagenome]